MHNAFATLSPDLVLHAVEHLGFLSDARIFALNSYENRVFQVGIEEEAPLIAKFYRPERWTNEAIREEHSFLYELAEREIAVVPPLQRDGESVFEYGGFRFALFPRIGGRTPEIENPDILYRTGQLLGQIHAVGACRVFQHRETRSFLETGEHACQFLLHNANFTSHETEYFQRITTELLARIKKEFEASYNPIRLQGDCHIGNLLIRDNRLHLVDFDDSRMGPALQDIWLLLSGERNEQRRQLAELIEGYQEFNYFPYSELSLLESLRTLRMLHHNAWLAARYQEPAFVQAFPWFNQSGYWQKFLQQLSVQRFTLDAAPLSLS